MLSRNVRFASSRNAAANPRERGQNHIGNRAEREEPHCAIASSKSPKINPQQTVGERRDTPGDETRREKRSGETQEAKDRNGSKKAKSHRGGEIALQRKWLKARSPVGYHQPGYENHG